MDGVFIWFAWMAFLFILWRVDKHYRRKQKEKFYEGLYIARQPRRNTASGIESGDTVDYEFKDRRGELRKITLRTQSMTDDYYIGNSLLGHLTGDTLQIPVPNGYREITIISIEKGEIFPSENHVSEPNTDVPTKPENTVL